MDDLCNLFFRTLVFSQHFGPSGPTLVIQAVLYTILKTAMPTNPEAVANLKAAVDVAAAQVRGEMQ